MGGDCHNVPLIKDNKGIRKLTPRECFNLQGFPKDCKLPNISDSKLYKLVGPAPNPYQITCLTLPVEIFSTKMDIDSEDPNAKNIPK